MNTYIFLYEIIKSQIGNYQENRNPIRTKLPSQNPLRRFIDMLLIYDPERRLLDSIITYTHSHLLTTTTLLTEKVHFLSYSNPI